ncbi:MAG: tetratricopeptide repeat protein [Verrucomicrobiales bacterium]|nr:tetratricopeptide repeat protein [Verrucomicrobiales bacterium]
MSKRRRVSKKKAAASPAIHGEEANPLPAIGPLRTSIWIRLAKSHTVAISCLVLLCTCLYAWTVDFPMVFDDDTYLKTNPFFHRDSFQYVFSFREFALAPQRMGTDPDFAVNFILRPVAYATFLLNYYIDGFNPRWYRVGNIAIHTANAALIYTLLTTLFRRLPEGRTLSKSSARFISITAAALFAAHPMAIESVTYIVQRFTSMVTMFSLAAACLHFMANGAISVKSRRWLRAGSVVCMLLAMQTKESSFPVPALLVLIDWLVCGSGLKQSIKRALPLLLCMPLIPVLVIAISAIHNGQGVDLGQSLQIVNSRDDPLHHWHYLMTQLTVIVHYLRLFIWPSGLNLDPEWPTYESLWQGPVLGSFCILAALTTSVWVFFRRCKKDARSALAWCSLCWFFVTISISSGVVPLPDMMAEHRTYLPSVGIMILISIALDSLRTAIPAGMPVLRKSPPAFATICCLALATATCFRNEVWRTRESLWSDAAEKSPNKFRVWGNLGAVISQAGNDAAAEPLFRKAIELEPRFQNGILNLSNSLLRMERPQEALDITLDAISQSEEAAGKAPFVYTLGLSFLQLRRFGEARSMFEQLLEINPNDPLAHRAIGTVYTLTRDYRAAIGHMRRALEINPADTEVRDSLEKLERKYPLAAGG